MIIYMCISYCEDIRERQTERDRERQTETGRQRQRQKERERICHKYFEQ